MKRIPIALLVVGVMLAGGYARAQEPAQPAVPQQRPPETPQEGFERAQRLALERSARAQEEQRARNIAALNDKTPLQVQVTVSRYNGNTKISSMPYILTVNAAGSERKLGDAENSRLRMGSQVPVPTVMFRQAKEPDGGSPAQPAAIQSFNYQDIGTNIDCRARSMGDGRFELGISVEERSIFTDVKEPAVPVVQQAPVVRSFQTSQNLILRDGQSRQFTAATDRVSGEVVRIDVTLSVVK